MSSTSYPNAPKRFRMSDFRATSDRYGSFAKSARFAVTISPRGSVLKQKTTLSILQDLTYLCEVAEMPGRGFMSIDYRYYGPNFKTPHQTEYADMSLTFLCRNKQYERQFFDDWMETINPTDTFDFRYRDDYSSSIDIWQFSDIGKDYADAEYCITLHDAYPILVNPQSASWGDDNFQRLTVAFTYTKWTRKGLDAESGQYKLVESIGNTVKVER
jgi:hypothetical protein